MKRHTLRRGTIFAITTLLLTWLVACQGGTDQNPPPTTRIAGTITVGLGETTLGTPVAQHPGEHWELVEDTEFVPGELLVAFKPGLSLQSLQTLSVDGVQLEHVRPLALPDVQLYRVEAGLGTLSVEAREEATLEAARALSARPDVLYAHPNYILKPLATPNDELYPYQWHYPAINLPQAWDITKGSAGTVVAVVDTGILHEAGNSARTHPEFAGNILPGYDFVSEPQVANDGDGRDPNAFDTGDTPGEQSSYHGTHVAGTIAAGTNNGTGVAGIDWHAKILPVRVLGVGGGSLLDILEGMIWAAGVNVQEVPNNSNPADVINMSLGGNGECFPAMQSFIDEALATGTIIVVAAGNENQNTANTSPASCAGVITVGATDFAGKRAPYSNYGTRVDVMAPGGNMNADLNGDKLPDGVLSTFFLDPKVEFSYGRQHGTSMAAPHVAGVVSLMKALNTNLTTQEALSTLRATARPLSAGQCQRASASECGAGLIDAYAALQAVQSGVIPPAPGQGELAFTPNLLDFGTTTNELSFTLVNTSGSSLNWFIRHYVPASDNPGKMREDSVYLVEGVPASGTLSAGASTTTAIGIDRKLVTAEGLYQFDLVFDVDGTEVTLPVRFSTISSGSQTPNGPMIVMALIEDENGEFVFSGFQQSTGFISSYEFDVEPGENYVVAWSDENSNNKIDQGDYLGAYPEPLLVTSGRNISGVDFSIQRVIEAGVLSGRLSDALGVLEQTVTEE
jgi:serine protease